MVAVVWLVAWSGGASAVPKRGPLRCHAGADSSKCIFHVWDPQLPVTGGATFATVNYATAQAWCRGFGAHVVRVATAAEAANVFAASRSVLGPSVSHWVGLDDVAVEVITVIFP